MSYEGLQSLDAKLLVTGKHGCIASNNKLGPNRLMSLLCVHLQARGGWVCKRGGESALVVLERYCEVLRCCVETWRGHGDW